MNKLKYNPNSPQPRPPIPFKNAFPPPKKKDEKAEGAEGARTRFVAGDERRLGATNNSL